MTQFPGAQRTPAHILVTGGAGFIGSHFVELALSHGIKVTIVDCFTYAGSRDNIEMTIKNVPILSEITEDQARENCIVVDANVCEEDIMNDLMEITDAVINFAAESHVDKSIANSRNFIYTNIIGMTNILNNAHELEWGNPGRQDKVILQVSTDEIYGSINGGSFSEKASYNPGNPYAATKASAEMMCKAYWNTYKVPFIITRGTNTFGTRQYPEKLIPIFITRLINREKISLFKGGEFNVRDWLHVEDHCNGILRALMYGNIGEAYNISGDCEFTNMEVALSLIRIAGYNPNDFMGYINDRPGHDYRYSINSDRLHKLGWERKHGRFDWEEELKRIATWYAMNVDWWKNKVTW